MLDNPDKYGIYPTTKCFNALDELYDKICTDAGIQVPHECKYCHTMVNTDDETCFANPKNRNGIPPEEIMPTIVEIYEAEKELCKWVPITVDPKEDGEYILYRPESESQHFAYFWCGTDIHGTHGWVGEGNIPLPVEEYSHYYKPLHAPMI